MQRSPAASSGRPSSLLDSLCSALAVAVPLALTALRVGPSPEWRDDVALVESLGFVPMSGEHAPSALLSALAALLPVGGKVLRAGLVGALGAALAGSAVYALARRMLASNASTPRLAPPLALAAAVTATLSPSFQYEGTRAGGVTLAVGLSLAVLFACDRADGTVRSAFALGALFGVVAAENRVAAFALLVALALRAVVAPRAPVRATLSASAAGAALVWAFFAVPFLLRPYSVRAALDLGADPSRDLGALFAGTISQRGALEAWAVEMGPIALGLGLAGLAWGVFRKKLRTDGAPLAWLAAAGSIAPVSVASPLAPDVLSPLRLLALSALAAAAVVGVQTAALALRRARVPLSEAASVLLVVFHLTLVFAAIEGSSNVVTETTGLGADVWTDEAESELPPGALLLVRSPTLSFRLWESRVVRGDRPDVVVVPLAMLGQGSVASELVRREPALVPLVRDMAMTGRASEYALATLADARPLYVELDPEWDKRLLDHLRPTPLWLGFTPHTLGRSDRTSALAGEDGRRAFRRVLGAAKGVPLGDRATLAVLGARAKEQAVVLAALGDRDSARRVLRDLGRIEPRSGFAAKLAERLEERGPIDARALLE
ncbi:MAG TPA: hypothetical protein VHC69_16040 [Polyangiaceae bacterium]|nr:hypothetical protein [Polyangiaceae bacterium]